MTGYVLDAHGPAVRAPDTAFIVVANGAHYGPFASREQAVAWADHPDRTFWAFRVEPLFGGIGITDGPDEDEQTPRTAHRLWHLDHGMPDRWYGACGPCSRDESHYLRPERLRRWTGVARP